MHMIFITNTEVSLLMRKSAPVHLFGIRESGPDARITDNLMSMTHYTGLRRDSKYPLQSGLALCVHKSVENRGMCRPDLEIETIKCIFIEITYFKTAPCLVGYVCRSPASSQPDDFINIMG